MTDTQAIARQRCIEIETQLQRERALNKDLLAGCQTFMGWLDSGLLVRDITKDRDQNWAREMMNFVMNLNRISAAILAATAEVEAARRAK